LQHFGVDVYSGILKQRPARWFRGLLVGLLTMESRLHRTMYPTPEQAQSTPHADMDEDGDVWR